MILVIDPGVLVNHILGGNCMLGKEKGKKKQCLVQFDLVLEPVN